MLIRTVVDSNMCTCIYTCARASTLVYVRVRKCSCMYTLCTCVCTCVRPCKHVYVYARMYTCMYKCTQLYVYMCVCMCMYIMLTFVYTCVRVFNQVYVYSSIGVHSAGHSTCSYLVFTVCARFIFLL